MENNYEEPTKDNVKIGDFLYDEIGNEEIHLPIIEVRTDVVIAKNEITECSSPYSKLIIKSGETFLVGSEIEKSKLNKILEVHFLPF